MQRCARRPRPGRRCAAPRAARYAARALRGGARALRGGAAPGAVRCGARRAARAEHLTVSIAHGSLTRRPFLERLKASSSLMFQFIVKRNHFSSNLTCAVCGTRRIASRTDNAARRASKYQVCAIFAVFSRTRWRRLIELAAGRCCPSAATRRTLAEAVRK